MVQEFAQRAQRARPDLVVAWGKGNAHTGVGDPYLPFREALGLLTGEAEALWAAGAISGPHARRLWSALPLAAQALVEDGPGLIGPFIAGRALLRRAVAAGGGAWLARLQEVVQGQGSTASPQQSDLFEQYSRVLQRLARQAPLLLWLDDLQWADGGSINLLFHLGRQLAGQRILIVGAYRPEEVALGRAGQRHPLQPVVNEFQREYGDIVVDLSRAEGREFMEAFLDSKRNRLGVAFRDMLYRQTGGHALFTIELLRGLEERGDLVQDDLGQWVEGPALDWETLPPRVEGVIAERIGRLPEALQEMLQAASVEGEVFSAGVVAGVLGADEREVVRRLSGELSKRHRLVAAASLQELGRGRQQLLRYRFGHFLFQKYLYGQLDDVQRMHLHGSMARILEALYRKRVAAGDARQYGLGSPAVAEGAVQLARHLEAAGMTGKAAEYRLHAGLRALMACADEEAIRHYRLGLALLERLPDAPERAEQELRLLRSLAPALRARGAWTDPQVARVYARMEQLCEQIDEVPLLLLNSTLWKLFDYHLNRAEYEKALQLAKRILALAPRAEDTLFIATAHCALGQVLTHMGEYASAREHLDCMIDFWHGQPQKLQCHIDWVDLVYALLHQSWVLWFLGYPDQALQRSQEAIAQAEELEIPRMLVPPLVMAGAGFHLFRRDVQAARESIERLVQLSAEQGLVYFQALGTFCDGYLLANAGQVEEGIERMRRGLAAIQATGWLIQRTHRLAMLSEAYAKARKAEDGLGLLAEALALVEKTGERYYEAELHRLKGELLWMQGDEAAAEASMRQAIEAARQQQAKSWELRATMCLSRLLQAQGKGADARPMLAEVYGWFREGFDTPDLQDAAALLDRLA
jgi:predicted ATPase